MREFLGVDDSLSAPVRKIKTLKWDKYTILRVILGYSDGTGSWHSVQFPFSPIEGRFITKPQLKPETIELVIFGRLFPICTLRSSQLSIGEYMIEAERGALFQRCPQEGSKGGSLSCSPSKTETLPVIRRANFKQRLSGKRRRSGTKELAIMAHKCLRLSGPPSAHLRAIFQAGIVVMDLCLSGVIVPREIELLRARKTSQRLSECLCFSVSGSPRSLNKSVLASSDCLVEVLRDAFGCDLALYT